MKKTQGVHPDTRREVLARAYFTCEFCGWKNNSLNIHHRTPRGMGGTRVKEINEPANLLVLCGSGTTGCHGWVESHRQEAYELGLLVKRGQNPELIPFQNKEGQIYTLLNNGVKFLWVKPVENDTENEL